jgi:polysaccharide biosynthesis transport protein
MPDQFLEWNDVKSFIRRRRKSFVFLFLIIFFSSIIVAFALPPIYRAETTLVIEEQQVPENFVGSAITNYAEERLSIIRQQIFSSERLREIIEKFELYPEIRQKHGMGEAVRKMRKSMGLETESVDFTNPKTGRTMSTIIAFALYYEGREPETAQKVANDLSELFLEEDIRLKEKKTAATTEFLSAELEALKEQLQLYEQKISDFKQLHFGVLPEHSSVNLASIGRLERELDRVNMQIRDLQDRKIIIEGQMANIDPLLPIKIDGENVVRNPAERLKYLRLNLISLQSKLHDKHPDISKLKREIQELENQVGVTGGYQEELKRLNSLKAELAGMEGRFGPNYPDVVKTKKEIQMLENSIAGKRKESRVRNLSHQVPDNPNYINLMTQKSSIDATIDNLMGDRRSIQEELVKFRQRIEKAPVVEKEYNELTRDYNTTKRKYDDVMNNLMAANVAKGVEEGEHGQRFEIKNYAYLPEKPYKPNRLNIILLGFVVASGLGIGLAALQEGLDTSIKTEKELSKLIGVPVLTVISKVETPKEKNKRLFRRLLLVCAFLGFMLIAAIIVNEYLMPLDEFWSAIVNNAKNM